MYRGTNIKTTADFSTETTQAKRHCHSIFKVLKAKTKTEKPSQLTITYTVKIFFKDEVQ